MSTENTALSLDGAAAALSATRPPEDAPAAETEPKAETAPAEAAPAPEIEAPEGGEQPEAGAESQSEGTEEEGAAEEAQPAEISLPKSWPAEHAETWESLPPEARAIIAEREGQRDRAVNQKFQEAANVLKANEALVTEAQSSRAAYAEAAEMVLSLVQPKLPPRSMLDPNSVDYDPDTYHYQKATYEDTKAFLDQHRNQLAQIRAQEEGTRFNALNNATREAFLKAVPEAADQAKAPAVFQGLMEYAISLGTPPETFNTPTTALEWLVLDKARKYDAAQEAARKAKTTPLPRVSAPGVARTKAEQSADVRRSVLQRLNHSGGVDDAVAALQALRR